ncbi:heterokaryon incompatibility protein-domain-containing protein [Hyaloscypha finlandica]|nr:heterokaryon incompatibility protein-domain-containing protein [Hyaloscypha finlandica]
MALELSSHLSWIKIDPSLRGSADNYDVHPSNSPETDISPGGTYQYQAFRERTSIRILSLKPASDPQMELQCELIETDRATAETYEALSYVWGKDEFPNILHLEGGYIKITASLASALTALRLIDKERNLWVDAVCINQGDELEKGHQVSMMAKIYREAAGVLAWLGQETKVFELQTAGLLNLSRMAINIGLINVNDSHHELLKRWIRSTQDGFKMAVDMMRMANLWNFWTIYSSSWFTRMWIVQEALLARQLTFCYGACTLHWDDFERVMILMYSIGESLHLPIESRDYFFKFGWNIVTVRDHYRRRLTEETDTGSEIAYYATQLNRRQCKDDRDRVYALLGILARDRNLHIQPDYSKSTVRVYLELARNALRLGHIGLLYEAGLCRRLSFAPPDLYTHPETGIQDLSKYLPSWAPDYRKSIASVVYVHGPQFSPAPLTWTPRFGTTFGKDPYICASITLPEDAPHRLITLGTLVDIITWVEPASFASSEVLRASHLDMFFIMRRFCKRLKEKFDSNVIGQSYPGGCEDLTRAFAYALVGGGTDDEYNKTFNLISSEQINPLDLWINYEKSCIEEDGEVYQAMVWERQNPEAEGKVSGVSYNFYSTGSKEASRAWSYTHHLVQIFRNHRFFMAADGYAGLAPLNTKDNCDDSVAFLDGANVPFVIRHLGDDTLDWALVGPCYVHGVMDAQAAMENKSFGGRTQIHLV